MCIIVKKEEFVHAVYLVETPIYGHLKYSLASRA